MKEKIQKKDIIILTILWLSYLAFNGILLAGHEQYEGYHKRRLSMTPGLTGVWQVSGRSDITDFEEIVSMDVEYIKNWSLKRDIEIILKTILVVFNNSGAK